MVRMPQGDQMSKTKIAISACLLGTNCKYNASNNLNQKLLDTLGDYELVPFCPEDFAFGSPRPTMDLLMSDGTVRAITEQNQDVTSTIEKYANEFFDTYPDIKIYIGKDKSPSCGVQNTKLYDQNKNILKINSWGLMSNIAKNRNIICHDEKGIK